MLVQISWDLSQLSNSGILMSARCYLIGQWAKRGRGQQWLNRAV